MVAVIFSPDTTATADQYMCTQYPKLTGCKGESYPGSQAFVFGVTVTNLEPTHRR